jgi:hypothetical protein
VRITDLDLEVVALLGGTVPNAVDLEALLETGRDAQHHVRNEAADQTVQRTHIAAVTIPRNQYLAVVLAQRDPLRDHPLELALRSFDRDVTLADRDVHARRDRYGCLSYS